MVVHTLPAGGRGETMEDIHQKKVHFNVSFLTLWSPCMPTIISLWIKFYISAEPNRDLASSGLWHMIEASVVSGSPSVKALTWSTKRWQYFTEYVAASRAVGVGGDYQEPLQHWFTASSVWIEKKRKKKVLGELVKEYLRSILSSHSLLHLYMSLF